MRLSTWTGGLAVLIIIAAISCAGGENDAALNEESERALQPLEPQASNSDAAVAEIDALLPDDGRPDRGAVLALYDWLTERFGAAADAETADYEFTPEELIEIAGLAPDRPLAERWAIMLGEMEHRHPGKVAGDIRWRFNAAGNVVCQIAMVYASPKEYVAFFGTPIGASGFSGRYAKADVWDIMVQGEMWTARPGEFEKSVFVPGQYSQLAKDDFWTFRYVDSTWMIDYGRGNILSMFPFGVISPALFNTLDTGSAWDQFVDYARLVIQGMLNP
jgi:C-8 sterol isomerase